MPYKCKKFDPYLTTNESLKLGVNLQEPTALYKKGVYLGEQKMQSYYIKNVTLKTMCRCMKGRAIYKAMARGLFIN